MPDCAIFADTHSEPASIYKWLDWLEEELSFPIYRVSQGNLTTKSLQVRNYQDGRPGSWVKSLIPAHIQNPDGTKGLMGRACTYDHKIRPLVKKQRELANIKRGQKECTLTVSLGISMDEAARRMKPSREPWAQNRFPLVELGMTREDCLDWMEAKGYPRPPRSACVYCPFHSNEEWRRLRDNEPKEFARACQFEKDLQAAAAKSTSLKGIPWLHRDMIPLEKVDLDEKASPQLKLWDDWTNECEGLCGT